MTSDTEYAAYASLPMLQWPSEAEAFLAFMRAREVRTYLEIGTASGRFALFVKRALGLPKIAVCDLWCPPLLRREPDVEFFIGDHHSREYDEWRRRLGHIDMVFIDADHENGYRRDFEIERGHPHRYIAMHDIANKAYPGLREFWRHEVRGEKWDLVNTDTAGPFGMPPIRYPFGDARNFQELVDTYGYSCGFGIVKADAAAG